MTQSETPTSSAEVKCSYHPDVMTRLRCSRCGKPICPKCGVRTPVGMRCPDCAGVRGLPTYKTDRTVLLRAGAVGFGIAAIVGLVWGYFPAWGFYLALVLGFTVADSMARVANGKRGLDLQVVGWIAVALGLVISRAVLANRLGFSWDDINSLTPFVEEQLSLKIIPDGLFAAIPFVLVFLRFR